MIRSISLVLLLTCASASIAQPLYKWSEADGSITFSPNRPPAGIPFETIEQGARAAVEPAAKASTPIPAVSTAVVAPLISNNGIVRSGSGSTDTALLKQSVPAAEPETDSAANRLNLNTGSAQHSDRVASIAASNKQSRCQDLRKRVVSLERRLKSRLTPEDMDNTVIHMAKYQRSFNQHCEQ